MKQILIKRGDIFWVDFDPAKATETQKTRPAIICSHDILNKNSSRVIVAPITSNVKKVYSFEYAIKNHSHVAGKVMTDQVRSIDKTRLSKKIGSFSAEEMAELDKAIRFVLGVP